MSAPNTKGNQLKRFENRNIIVTGASRGIGASLAERLCAEGANVAIVARTVDKHDHLAGSLNEVYYLPVETAGRSDTNELKRPSRSPSADGRYEQSILFANVNATVLF